MDYNYSTKLYKEILRTIEDRAPKFIMVNAISMMKVELSTTQLALLRTLTVEYKNRWESKGQLPLHITDLLDSLYQLSSPCSQQDNM